MKDIEEQLEIIFEKIQNKNIFEKFLTVKELDSELKKSLWSTAEIVKFIKTHGYYYDDQNSLLTINNVTIKQEYLDNYCQQKIDFANLSNCEQLVIFNNILKSYEADLNTKALLTSINNFLYQQSVHLWNLTSSTTLETFYHLFIEQINQLSTTAAKKYYAKNEQLLIEVSNSWDNIFTPVFSLDENESSVFESEYGGDIQVVYKLTLEQPLEKYVKFFGNYTSYEGAAFERCKIVSQKTKTVIYYE